MFLFFSFPLIPQDVRTVRVERVKDGWASHTVAGVRIISKPLFPFICVGSKSSWLFNISDAHGNSRGHTSSSWPPKQSTWTRFILTWYPRNLYSISTENTCVPFTLVTRCISSYFRSASVQFLPLYPQRELQVNIQHSVTEVRTCLLGYHSQTHLPQLCRDALKSKEPILYNYIRIAEEKTGLCLCRRNWLEMNRK